MVTNDLTYIQCYRQASTQPLSFHLFRDILERQQQQQNVHVETIKFTFEGMEINFYLFEEIPCWSARMVYVGNRFYIVNIINIDIFIEPKGCDILNK